MAWSHLILASLGELKAILGQICSVRCGMGWVDVYQTTQEGNKKVYHDIVPKYSSPFYKGLLVSQLAYGYVMGKAKGAHEETDPLSKVTSCGRSPG